MFTHLFKSKVSANQRRVSLQVECLEDRVVLSESSTLAGLLGGGGEPLASLSGFVFVDANANGLRETGETGVAGVTITLLDADGATVATTTTAGDGAYSFSDLAEGDYSIVQTQPAGYGSSTSNTLLVMLTSAGLTEQNFGETTATISGFVFNDGNNNGVRDPGEAGVFSVTITLTGTDVNGDAVKRTTVTAADGSYRFTLLLAGTYTITETQPEGLLDGNDSAGNSGGTVGDDEISDIALDPAEVNTNVNFGELSPASIAGSVFRDANNNAFRDTQETGIEGVTVTLAGIDDRGQGVTRTATTDSNGDYTFTNLRPGTYTIVETHPAAFLDGQESAGDSGGTVGNDQVSNITLRPGDSRTGVTFGEIDPVFQPSSLAGIVFRDLNDNGVQDAGETGIAGVSLTLSGTNDQGAITPITVTTLADGSYLFAGLRPGTYVIRQTQPQGFFDGKETVGTLSGTVLDNQFSEIVLAANQNGTGYNFGELPHASLSGFVYVDSNRNGQRDFGEAGIRGVAINLTGDETGGISITRTTTTDANGFYQFTELRAGTYRIRETQAANFLDGNDAVGSLGGTVANDDLANIPVRFGDAGINYVFGERGLRPEAISKNLFLASTPAPSALAPPTLTPPPVNTPFSFDPFLASLAASEEDAFFVPAAETPRQVVDAVFAGLADLEDEAADAVTDAAASFAPDQARDETSLEEAFGELGR